MYSPYQRRRPRRIPWWQLALMTLIVVLMVIVWERLGAPLPGLQPASTPTLPSELAPNLTPTIPERLTRADVLPTPTIDPAAIPRAITFPGALVTSRIINAARTAQSWETRYLGNSVGHLQGTSWIGEPGGNIVLAGHVTNERGEPGPFAYLFEAQIGDEVILHDGEREYLYRVTTIVRVPPDAIEYVAQDGIPRLTLITCDDWDLARQEYNTRLVVVAEPVGGP